MAGAIDRAAARWPGESRAQLLVRLVDIGRQTLEEYERIDAEGHRVAVTASSGAYPDAFGPGYLAELRADWPA